MLPYRRKSHTTTMPTSPRLLPPSRHASQRKMPPRCDRRHCYATRDHHLRLYHLFIENILIRNTWFTRHYVYASNNIHAVTIMPTLSRSRHATLIYAPRRRFCHVTFAAECQHAIIHSRYLISLMFCCRERSLTLVHAIRLHDRLSPNIITITTTPPCRAMPRRCRANVKMQHTRVDAEPCRHALRRCRCA